MEDKLNYFWMQQGLCNIIKATKDSGILWQQKPLQIHKNPQSNGTFDCQL